MKALGSGPSSGALIHLDFLMQDGNKRRVSLNSRAKDFKQGGIAKPGVVPLAVSQDRWEIKCIDLDYVLKTLSMYAVDNLRRKRKFELIGLQICSQIMVKGVYTSDNLYGANVSTNQKFRHLGAKNKFLIFQTMPKEFGFRVPKESQFGELFDFNFIPRGNFNLVKPIVQAKPSGLGKATVGGHQSSNILDDDHEDYFSDGQNLASGRQQPTKNNFLRYLKPDQEDTDTLQGGESNTRGDTAASLKKEIFGKSRSQNPLLGLKRITGFTGNACPDIRWSRDLQDQRLAFASGNIVVMSDVTGNQPQNFLRGSTQPITCLDVSKDGRHLAACQEGAPKPILRIWCPQTQKQLCRYSLELKEARCLSFSFDGNFLCIAGNDKLSRDEIIVVELTEGTGDGQGTKLSAKMVARQVSEFSILTIKFSPIESDKIVTCGKENIRFWRVKNQHLPGGAVVLNHHARNTIFTVFDFDFGASGNKQVSDRDDVVRRVLVGSMHGFLYQVNYDSRQLEAVFKIHDLSICSIAVMGSGYCVTGSQDQYIRVWPLDFSEFFLEAKHEGVIVALDISADGLSVACGTLTGSLSVLDIESHNYKSVMRSHSQEIVKLSYQAHSDLLISLSKDNSIRVWACQTMEQLYEFDYTSKDECISIAAHPSQRQIAGGFSSGIVRIFEIESVEVVHEHKFHNCQVEEVVYSPSGRYLLSGDAKGFFSMYAADKGYEFVKSFEPEIGNTKVSAGFSPDEQFFAKIGETNQCIGVWALGSFTKVYDIVVKGAFAHSLFFTDSMKNYELVVLTCERKMRVYQLGLEGAKRRGDLKDTHQNFISGATLTPNLKYFITVGGDKQVALWDHKFRLNSGPSGSARFSGHSQPIYSLAVGQYGKVFYTAGGQEGIYEWEYLGDVNDYSETMVHTFGDTVSNPSFTVVVVTLLAYQQSRSTNRTTTTTTPN